MLQLHAITHIVSSILRSPELPPRQKSMKKRPPFPGKMAYVYPLKYDIGLKKIVFKFWLLILFDMEGSWRYSTWWLAVGSQDNWIRHHGVQLSHPESYRFVSTYSMLIASHGTAHHVPLVGYRPKRKSLRKNSQRKVPSVPWWISLYKLWTSKALRSKTLKYVTSS